MANRAERRKARKFPARLYCFCGAAFDAGRSEPGKVNARMRAQMALHMRDEHPGHEEASVTMALTFVPLPDTLDVEELLRGRPNDAT